MSDFVQGKAEDFGFLGIGEEGSYFCLSGRCSNKFEDSACDMNGAI